MHQTPLSDRISGSRQGYRPVRGADLLSALYAFLIFLCVNARCAVCFEPSGDEHSAKTTPFEEASSSSSPTTAPPSPCLSLYRTIIYDGRVSRVSRNTYCSAKCTFDPDLSRGCAYDVGISYAPESLLKYVEKIVDDPGLISQPSVSERPAEDYIDYARMAGFSVACAVILFVGMNRWSRPTHAAVIIPAIAVITLFFDRTPFSQVLVIFTSVISLFVPSNTDVGKIVLINEATVLGCTFVSLAIDNDYVLVLCGAVAVVIIGYNMLFPILNLKAEGFSCFAISTLQGAVLATVIHKVIVLRAHHSPVFATITFGMLAAFPLGDFPVAFLNLLFSVADTTRVIAPYTGDKVLSFFVGAALNLIVFIAVRAAYGVGMRVACRAQAPGGGGVERLSAYIIAYIADPVGFISVWYYAGKSTKRSIMVRALYSATSLFFFAHEAVYARDVMLVRIFTSTYAYMSGSPIFALSQYIGDDASAGIFAKTSPAVVLRDSTVCTCREGAADINIIKDGGALVNGGGQYIGRGEFVTVAHVARNAETVAVNTHGVSNTTDFNVLDIGPASDPPVIIKVASKVSEPRANIGIYNASKPPVNLFYVTENGHATITGWHPNDDGTISVDANFTFGNSGSPIFGISPDGNVGVFAVVSSGTTNPNQGNIASIVRYMRPPPILTMLSAGGTPPPSPGTFRQVTFGHARGPTDGYVRDQRTTSRRADAVEQAKFVNMEMNDLYSPFFAKYTSLFLDADGAKVRETDEGERRRKRSKSSRKDRASNKRALTVEDITHLMGNSPNHLTLHGFHAALQTEKGADFRAYASESVPGFWNITAPAHKSRADLHDLPGAALLLAQGSFSDSEGGSTASSPAASPSRGVAPSAT